VPREDPRPRSQGPRWDRMNPRLLPRPVARGGRTLRLARSKGGPLEREFGNRGWRCPYPRLMARTLSASPLRTPNLQFEICNSQFAIRIDLGLWPSDLRQ